MDKYRKTTTYVDDMKRFSQYLYEARLERRKNNKVEPAREVSRNTGISYNCLISMEKQKQMPFLDTIIKICRYYNLSIDRFFGLGKYKDYGEIPVRTFEELCKLDPNKRRNKWVIPDDIREFLMSFRDRRISAGETLEGLSPKIGISYTVISQVERGVIIPNENHLKILCKFYKVNKREIPETLLRRKR